MKQQAALKIFYTNCKCFTEKDLFEKGLSLVNETRRKKVLACKQEADRCRSLAAGLLVRYACGQIGYDYDAMHFSEGRNHKPLAENMHFNLSHSGDFAAIVIGDAEAGIDIECLLYRFGGARGKERFFGVLERCFTEEELAQVMRVSEAEEAEVPQQEMSTCEAKEACSSGNAQRHDGKQQVVAGRLWLGEEAYMLATEIWTRKESYAKSSGIGLGLDFSKISVLDEPGFTSYRMADGYVISTYSDAGGLVEFPVCVRAQEMVR